MLNSFFSSQFCDWLENENWIWNRQMMMWLWIEPWNMFCEPSLFTKVWELYQQSRHLGAGTRSRIQARLSGINIYYARTSKLVSDFLSLERSLVTNSAHVACSRAGTWAAWAELVTKDRSRDKKSETSFEVLA